MLSAFERKIILDLARKAIAEYLQAGMEISPPDEPFLCTPSGAFVTIKIQGELRGCIGFTEPKYSLGETIVHCAVLAAVKDPRFPPMGKEELDPADIEVSVLSEFQQIRSVDEIEVGKHGLFITSGMNRGLLLPQVATEQNWNLDAFLRFTCRKAGLPHDAWKTPGVKVEIFTAEVFGEKERDEG